VRKRRRFDYVRCCCFTVFFMSDRTTVYVSFEYAFQVLSNETCSASHPSVQWLITWRRHYTSTFISPSMNCQIIQWQLFLHPRPSPTADCRVWNFSGCPIVLLTHKSSSVRVAVVYVVFTLKYLIAGVIRPPAQLQREALYSDHNCQSIFGLI
jgi:hypothetical protein